MARSTPRAGRVHKEIVDEAGFGRISWISILAGLITAYGTFAVVAAIVGSVLSSANVDTEFRTNDWTGSGAVAALAAAVTLRVAYLFGGYVAGRMARRAGSLHGVLVFVAALVTGAIAGGVVAALTDDAAIRSNLRSIGVPTNWDQVSGVSIAGAILSIAAILIGSVLGGMLGERWHTRLATRAADPDIGPAADARRQADLEDEARDRRIAADPTVAAEQERQRDADIDLRDRDDVWVDERADGDVPAGTRRDDLPPAPVHTSERFRSPHDPPR